jgi:hypothetical protein
MSSKRYTTHPTPPRARYALASLALLLALLVLPLPNRHSPVLKSKSTSREGEQ